MVATTFGGDDNLPAFCPHCQEGCSCEFNNWADLCEGCTCDVSMSENGECGCEDCTCGGDNLEVNIP